VARTEDPDDRRARNISLTAKGRAIIEKGIDESYRWIDDLAKELGPRGRATVRAALPVLMKAEASLPRPEKHSARKAMRRSR
jgi:DNA-binding MarR family transcriptional regulator